uniref:Uncharacterized protein n=1 Tax=Guillardia theta TaxID=55529 RepID=A0A7S4KGD5_GUITH|mmetsp:Transcript_24361/g.79599  ORF Transcript_24361/g.79599 Transcript_24361/m.79599 type:complete len:269 (+) Transcript_24361:473-1279(+)
MSRSLKSVKEVFWFQPNNYPATKEETLELERLLYPISGRNISMRPDNPPPRLLELLVRMSTFTQTEIDLILQCLSLYKDQIALKELGPIASKSMRRVMGDHVGLPELTRFFLDRAKAGLNKTIVKNNKRQTKLRAETHKVQETFEKAYKDIHFARKHMWYKEKSMAEAKASAEASRQRELSLVKAQYSNICSDLESQQEFYATWKKMEGEPSGSFRSLNSIFHDRNFKRTMRQNKTQAERAEKVEADALEYALQQMQQEQHDKTEEVR